MTWENAVQEEVDDIWKEVVRRMENEVLDKWSIATEATHMPQETTKGSSGTSQKKCERHHGQKKNGVVCQKKWTMRQGLKNCSNKLDDGGKQTRHACKSGRVV